MPAHFRLPDATRIGRARLRVADLARSLAFYVDVLGLSASGDDGQATLVAQGGLEPLVELREHVGAPRKPPQTTGLYHLAILAPDRRALGRIFLRLRARHWPLQGMSDHGVSEALYLADAEENGIEIYADRPRSTWTRRGTELYMTTRRLDLNGLLREAGSATEGEGGGEGEGLPAGTRIGHIHLHVSDLARAEAFYHGVLGFDVVVRSYPGALFLSAGGYHHHIGVNTWAGPHATPPSPEATGLMDFEILVPRSAEAALLARLRAAGHEPGPAPRSAARGGEAAGWRVTDPDGNGVVLSFV